jgi:hypothetical protein
MCRVIVARCMLYLHHRLLVRRRQPQLVSRLVAAGGIRKTRSPADAQNVQQKLGHLYY